MIPNRSYLSKRGIAQRQVDTRRRRNERQQTIQQTFLHDRVDDFRFTMLGGKGSHGMCVFECVRELLVGSDERGAK